MVIDYVCQTIEHENLVAIYGCGWVAGVLEKLSTRVFCSDVKRGQNVEAEAEVNFSSLRPRPRPKIIVKKYQIMI